ncbi:hypothetical protein F5Y19DRAFT_481762 [Xylariaceae sp. FL1651]|nr:hypothetical protein F5Y19DRAFT_481762 [Xylariaceae sp. FL1651]
MAPQNLAFANALVWSIMLHGELSDPSNSYPLGRVCNWKAVHADMQRKGYTQKMSALQSRWSRDARGRLAANSKTVNIKNATSNEQYLGIIAGVI